MRRYGYRENSRPILKVVCFDGFDGYLMSENFSYSKLMYYINRSFIFTPTACDLFGFKVHGIV